MTLVERILVWLQRHGVREAVLNLHYLPQTVTRVVGDGAHLALRVRYTWEPVILGTAGGPRRALPLLGQQFFIVNGDTLTDLNLGELVDAHVRRGARVTLAVMENPAPQHYGGVLVDGDGWVRGFVRAGTSRASWHFVGVQIADASVFEGLNDGEQAATIGGLYDALVTREPHAILAHDVGADFHDVGTPGDYFRTAFLIAGQLDDVSPSVLVGHNVRVHPSVMLNRTILWDDVTIETDCALTRCIVTDGVSVPRGSEFADAALLPAATPAARGSARRLGDLLVFDIS
jgi:NDP-sugar pyrophosphorylase family protein